MPIPLLESHLVHHGLDLSMNDFPPFQILRGAAVCVGSLALALGLSLFMAPRTTDREILHASFDSSRELLAAWHAHLEQSPQYEAWGRPTYRISNNGSAAQARAVRDGLKADIVSLSFELDWQILHKQGLVDSDWRRLLPKEKAPWYAAVVFVVRKGNPHGIRDWPDLIDKPVKVVMPNPKTAGVARVAVLTAWAFMEPRLGKEGAERFLGDLCARVPVFDPSARLSTTSFTQKGIGDVQITWEPEAFLEVQESKGELEMVRPSMSYRIEPAIGLIRPVSTRKGTLDIAEKYLDWVYSEPAQKILAENHFRPADPKVAEKFADKFPPMRFLEITEIFKNWDEAMQTLFADEAVVDRALKAAAASPANKEKASKGPAR